MAEENKAAEAASEANETTAQVSEATQEVAQEETPQQDPKEFLESFDWEKYEEGIEKVDDSKLSEFEKLVAENFVDTADEEVVKGKGSTYDRPRSYHRYQRKVGRCYLFK